jgi:tetratricopeptide (TPR) repeat protein
VSITLWSLAAVYEEEKKFEEALPLLWRAFQIKENNLGADDPQSIFILEQYANTLQELGRTAEADLMHARAKQLSVAKKASP